ncbi:hypothetical protein Ddye_000893 [Dipteronia dyeriana]|uniref:Uncharacterized protein n=1 Tax=Dipteronia dyeriana TaxID=168575 RepID=A0AAE0CT14_9ROSI|nr:hypothetical protein Ddye_000893 [Dipteronia dyeriana]
MLKLATPLICASNTMKSQENSKYRHLSFLKNCSHLIQFKQVHAQIIKTSSNSRTITDTQLAKLIESLVKSSQIEYAHLVFSRMVEPSTFAFNIMIRGYEKSGLNHEAILLYIQMRCEGLEPDNFTFGDIESARLLFDRMPERNVVTWTAMINGHVKQKRYKEGLELFSQMRNSGIEMNELTLVSVLSACANLGAIEMGKWVHEFIDRHCIFLNPKLGAAVIDMYGKCGNIEEASKVFKIVPQKSVCTWNSIIGGLAMHGCGEEALEMFSQMQTRGIKPDDITLIAVLSACTHSGLVEKGKEIFCKMRKDHKIDPNIKHYGCLVDLLCRAGLLDEVYEVMSNMPIEPNAVLWGSLLTACAAAGNVNVELAETAMERLIKLEPCNDGNYVLMSNIYAAEGRWDDVAKMRRLMTERQIFRNPGHSLIEIDNFVHEFMVGDGRHPCSKEIYSMLEDIATSLREEDYAAVISL